MGLHEERPFRKERSRDEVMINVGCLRPFGDPGTVLIIDTTDTTGRKEKGKTVPLTHVGRPTVPDTVDTTSDVWQRDRPVIRGGRHRS